jgi:hypothetical protein
MAELDPLELIKLKDVIGAISGDTFPSNHADFLWNTYKHLNNVEGNRPSITCGCTADRWREVITFHRQYVKDK